MGRRVKFVGRLGGLMARPLIIQILSPFAVTGRTGILPVPVQARSLCPGKSVGEDVGVLVPPDGSTLGSGRGNIFKEVLRSPPLL